MQVTDRFNLLPPSFCIICEESPSGRVIDTQRQLKTGVASAFNGRKYVCERCVTQMANKLGFVSDKDAKQAIVDRDFAERQLAVFRGRVVEIAEAVQSFAVHPGAAVEDDRKPEVEEVFPPEPEVKGGTTKGVYKASDSETPAVPAPAVAEAGVAVEEDESEVEEVDDEVESDEDE